MMKCYGIISIFYSKMLLILVWGNYLPTWFFYANKKEISVGFTVRQCGDLPYSLRTFIGGGKV